jgi:hypothetical protein
MFVKTRAFISLLGASLLIAGLLAPIHFRQAAGSNEQKKILDFDVMVGVSAPYTGSTNPIRGIDGAGAPWVLDQGMGKLTADGDIQVVVKGLIVEPLGTNPVPAFKAIVSCLSKDSSGNPITVNISTATAPAESSGDAVIRDKITLPDPCIAPIVFVTSSGGSWFAATGF